jgi:TonB family protein
MYQVKKLGLFLFILMFQGCSNQQSMLKANINNYIENPSPFCHELISTVINNSCDLDNLNKAQSGERFLYFEAYHRKFMGHYSAPKNDGKNYYGQVTFCIDQKGKLGRIELLQPSGHKGLDNAVLSAVSSIDSLPLPEDECALKSLQYNKMIIFYSHNDMTN